MKRNSLALGGLHLAVLWALAFQRPLFDLLGDNPEFFVARGNTRGDILAYALAFTLLPPLAMLAIEALALRLRRDFYEGLHLILVGTLGAAFALQLLKDDVATGPAGALIVAALVLGGVLAFAYRRTAFAPQALSVLAPAPLLFLAILLLFSPVHKLVLPQKQAVAAASIDARAPVVVLLYDEFPLSTLLDENGEVDARRFPNFAQLAARSTWYRNATTVADKTPRAVPAILTGHNPGYRLLPVASDQSRNLFTLFGGTYRVQATETATRMCPQEVCHESGAPSGGFGTRFRDLVSDLRVVSEHLLAPRSIERRLPPVGQTFGGFGATAGEPQETRRPKVTARYQQDYDAKLRRERRLATPGGKAEMFANFVRPIGGADRVLNFLDIQLPHYPWEYAHTGQGYGQHFPDMNNFIVEDPPGRFIDNQWLADQSYARHMLQAGASDHLLGTLIARLKREGIWDRAAIVVSADHGVSFHAGGLRRDVDADNLADIAFVPLFVKTPGQTRGRVIDAHTCLTETPHLLMAALGTRWPWGTDRCDPQRVAVLGSFGSTQRGSLATYEARREATVERKLALFGRSWDSVYGFGPNPELIGRELSSLSVRREARGRNRVVFDPESDTSDVDPRGAQVPALLQATVAALDAPPDGAPLAIAVNGRIAAVTRAYELAGKTRFIATVQPRSYRRGRNSVEVFTIAGASSRLSLHSLGGANLSR
jgi:sulfatase-like protein